MARFKSICDGYGVEKGNISVFATEAMRTAKNQDVMLGAIKKASGMTVDILSPGMESLFGAMGARSGYTDVDGLFMDLGGGSVQMTYVNSKTKDNYDVLAAEAATSMPFGAAKLTAALSAEDTAHAAKTELRKSMKATFEGLTAQFPKLKEQAESSEGVTIYFCGGGFRGYGSMLMHTDPIQPYPIPAIGGYTVPGYHFIKWREMLHTNNYFDGKVFGMSKRRRQQFPAIVSVVQSLVEAIPKIKQVIFCAGGNREGVLYMKLPPETRESHPLLFLPLNGPEPGPVVSEAVPALIKSALPDGCPAIFTDEILRFIACNIWLNLGSDTNSSTALHNCVSGNLAGLPGLNHEIRAAIACTIVSRWGSDLGTTDQPTYAGLRALMGSELSWWCEYIGTLASFLGYVLPYCPTSKEKLHELVGFDCSTGHGLGKKGKKVGIKLKISLAKSARTGLSVGGLEDMFKKVGKGLHIEWVVDAEIVD
jgi:retrograde regulation protein 2